MKASTLAYASLIIFAVTTAACSRDRGQVVTAPETTTKKPSSDSSTTTPSDDTQQRDETDQGSGSVITDDNTLVRPESTEDTTATPSTTSVAKTCLEELQAKFGADITFPAQQLLPNQYEQARAQGANGQAALKTILSSGSCNKLKANE